MSDITANSLLAKCARVNSVFDRLEEPSTDAERILSHIALFDPFLDWVQNNGLQDEASVEVAKAFSNILDEAAVWGSVLDGDLGTSSLTAVRLTDSLQRLSQVARSRMAPSFDPNQVDGEGQEIGSLFTNSDLSADDEEAEYDPVAANLYDAGMQLFTGSETQARCFRDAAAKFLEAAAIGHPEASKKLGDMYLYGKGVKKDYAEAVNHYNTAAIGASGVAAFNIASLFFKGEETAQSPEHALSWYNHAAALQFTKANQAAAFMQAVGFGTENNKPNLAGAFENLRTAAKENDADSQFALGVCYAYGIGITPNARRSTAWVMRAARNSHLEAQFTIGSAFMDPNHDGVVVNHAYAFLWLSKAAERGHIGAQSKLGDLYSLTDDQFVIPEPVYENYQNTESSEPTLVRPVHNIDLAEKWYECASKQGFIEAKFKLAVILYNKAQLTLDENAKLSLNATAEQFLRNAAAAGHAQAQFLLAEKLSNGFDPSNLDLALPWVKTSAESNFVPALMKLISWLESNLCSLDQLEVQSISNLYERAAKEGDEAAVAWLQSRNIAANSGKDNFEVQDEIPPVPLLPPEDDMSDHEEPMQLQNPPSPPASLPPSPPLVSAQQEQNVSIEELGEVTVIESSVGEPKAEEPDSEQFPPPPPPPPADFDDYAEEGESTPPPPPPPQPSSESISSVAPLMTLSSQKSLLEDSSDENETGIPNQFDPLAQTGDFDTIALPPAPED